MKNLILGFLAVVLATQVYGQSPSYVDFEWDILQFGYAVPFSGDESGGVAVGMEVRYNATDNFSIGLGGQGVVFGGDFGDNVDVGTSASSLIIGDYYFSNTSGTRPFLGLGVGLFQNGTITIRNGDVEDVIDGVSGFGTSIRGGYEFGHIRLQGHYNLTLKEGMTDYFGITLGLTLWGGYKGS